MGYIHVLGQLRDTDDAFLRHHIKNYLSTLSGYQRLVLIFSPVAILRHFSSLRVQSVRRAFHMGDDPNPQACANPISEGACGVAASSREFAGAVDALVILVVKAA